MRPVRPAATSRQVDPARRVDRQCRPACRPSGQVDARAGHGRTGRPSRRATAAGGDGLGRGRLVSVVAGGAGTPERTTSRPTPIRVIRYAKMSVAERSKCMCTSFSVGTTTIMFGATRYGPSAPVDLPVGEVAHPHQHRARRSGRRRTTRRPRPITTSDTVTAGSVTGSIGSLGQDDVDLTSVGAGFRADCVASRRRRRPTRCHAVGTVGHHGNAGPLVAMLEPARADLEPALAVVAGTTADDDGLRRQRRDDVAPCHLVDVPRAAPCRLASGPAGRPPPRSLRR